MENENRFDAAFHPVFRFRWMKVAVFYFLLASVLGALMRYLYIHEIPFLDYKHVLHAHSHLALLGWGYMFVSGAMLFLLIKKPVTRAIYHKIFILNTTAAFGMTVFFLYQGYGIYSITFSTVHLISVYLFAYYFLRDFRIVKPGPHSPFIRWSIYWLLISSLGLWAIAPVSAILGKLHPLYYMSIQFFLHFQFNGWFTYAVIGLLIYYISGKNTSVVIPASGFVLLQLSLLLTYALSVTWSTPMSIVFYLNTVGVILQAAAFYLIIRSVFRSYNPFRSLTHWTDWLLMFGIVCLILKVMAQMAVAVPAIATISYTIRNYVIGFIHLIVLGFVSLTGAAVLIKSNLLSKNSTSGWGWVLLLIAFTGTEALLFGQGTLLWMELGFITHYHLLLFGITLLFPISLSVILAGFKRPDFANTS
ncbi:hypothetical protein FNH22_22600 [Fulvivirga sp. M361]|uniref:hypothetical protein n=1 Tax=Fulvivirga sp. M361 TaxID=2594266 RepID=UPI00117ABB0B|nr:hypothetical protein [Fulvivirga sp. M361]TRX52212.1 hypothetical protein FNH22_22600 [Fulvivirga sp. M361]